jgi:TPR repeat protein
VANQGNANAQVNIGVLYSLGIGISKSYKDSFKYAKLAANQGNMVGQSNLGYLYHTPLASSLKQSDNKKKARYSTSEPIV